LPPAVAFPFAATFFTLFVGLSVLPLADAADIALALVRDAADGFVAGVFADDFAAGSVFFNIGSSSYTGCSSSFSFSASAAAGFAFFFGTGCFFMGASSATSVSIPLSTAPVLSSAGDAG
jgi:hypothetical protein